MNHEMLSERIVTIQFAQNFVYRQLGLLDVRGIGYSFSRLLIQPCMLLCKSGELSPFWEVRRRLVRIGGEERW